LKKEWLVIELNKSEILKLHGIKELELNNSGTLVIWEILILLRNLRKTFILQ